MHARVPGREHRLNSMHGCTLFDAVHYFLQAIWPKISADEYAASCHLCASLKHTDRCICNGSALDCRGCVLVICRGGRT
eukprot:6177956-Pleurochrysis_carterae.AAC.3